MNNRIGGSPRAAFDVRVGLVAGSTILVRGSTAFEINEVGAFLWERFSGEKSLEVIADELASEYAVDPRQALLDTNEFTAELSEAGLLE